MKQTIPFKKDITFKTKIGELTAIALDNDLTLKGEDLIVGNFYISGNYKMHEGSVVKEEYSYKIPCEIAISDDYDTFDATIDIDDFYYEIINDEILRVNIRVVIDNLSKKEDPREETLEVLKDEEPLAKEEELFDFLEEPEKEERQLSLPTEKDNLEKQDNQGLSFLEAKEKLGQKEDNYQTYKVYIYKEEDTVEKVLEKYNLTLEELTDYNDLENLMPGTKLVLPCSND